MRTVINKMRTVIKMSFIIFIILNSVIFSTKAAPPGTPILSFDINPPNKEGDIELIINVDPQGKTFSNCKLKFSYSGDVQSVDLSTISSGDLKDLTAFKNIVGNNIEIHYGRPDPYFNGSGKQKVLGLKAKRGKGAITFTWDKTITTVDNINESFTYPDKLVLEDHTFPAISTAGRTLSITSTEASPGSKTTVQITITDATGLAAGDILVKYDANVLTVGEVRGTDLISSLNLVINKDVPGEIKLPMAGTKGIPSGSGALVEIELTVSKDAKVGTETTLSFSDTEIYDESGAVIPVSLENGVVKITQQGIKGDVNNDGKVRSNDAMLALRIAAGLMVPSDYQKWSADMNDDGKIRSNDAMLILRKAAGLPVPNEEPAVDKEFLSPMPERTITIMLGEAYGVAGESITVPLKVDNALELAGGDICIDYDKMVLRAIGVSSNPDILLASNIAEPGTIQMAVASANKLSNATLAKIRFEVVADDISPLTLQQVVLYQYDVRQYDVLPFNTIKIDGQFRSWAVPPEHSALLQNFPNPFNPETWIPYQLAEGGGVTIRIYNVKGQIVKTLELGYKPAGVYTHRSRAAYWDGKNDKGDRVASGVYFYTLQAGEFRSIRKMVIVK